MPVSGCRYLDYLFPDAPAILGSNDQVRHRKRPRHASLCVCPSPSWLLRPCCHYPTGGLWVSASKSTSEGSAGVAGASALLVGAVRWLAQPPSCHMCCHTSNRLSVYANVSVTPAHLVTIACILFDIAIDFQREHFDG